MNLEQFELRFEQRFQRKKKLNIFLCQLIFILGATSFVFKALYEGGVWTCFREMTVCGTVFSSILALFYAILSVYELKKNKEAVWMLLYYLRLSSATVEFIILFVVIIGYLPFVPANPVIGRYDMINMHVLVPILTLISFVLNDSPRGKLKPPQYMGGLSFLILYTCGMLFCILMNIIPEGKIPYFFLDIRHQPLWFTVLAFIIVYDIGYVLSWLFSELNRKMSWQWYKMGIHRTRK